jgi:C4-type Zn-finger protein
VRTPIVHVCPNCGGRVKIEHADVTIDGNVEVVVLEGVCEACGAKYRLTKRIYLKTGHPWRCGHQVPAIAW